MREGEKKLGGGGEERNKLNSDGDYHYKERKVGEWGERDRKRAID